jgi:DNA-binding response OmpR family regulator
MIKKRIIIADDDSTIHAPLTYYLTEAGYEVMAFDDSQNAFDEILKANNTDRPFDLLITDIEMPGLSGLELIDKLNGEHIAFRVLVITGFGDKKTIARLAQRGCSDYLDKPIQEQELLIRIESIFNIQKKQQ